MTSRPTIAIIACCALIAATSACTYHRAHFNHEDYADQVPLSSESFDGEALGPVAANEAGAVWNDCTKSAKGTVWILIDETKRMGGNAIGEIRWIPKKEKKGARELPTCKKAWGWLAIWPVVLSPVFMSSRAEAQAYRIPEGAATSKGIYRIPDSDEERAALVERIVAGS